MQVGWVKADTKAIQAIHDHVITHNPRVSVSHLDVSTWNLHIKSVSEEDRGGYMCQINTDPMKSQVNLKYCLKMFLRILKDVTRMVKKTRIRKVVCHKVELKMTKQKT